VDLQEEWAWQRILRSGQSVIDNLPELNGIVSEAAQTFLSIVSNAHSNDVLERAFAVLSLCLRESHRVIEEYLHSRTTGDQPGSETPQPEWLRSAVHLSEHVAANFAGRAEDASKSAARGAEQGSEIEAEQWFHRVQPLLEILIEQPYVPVSYLLIRGLKELVGISPANVLLWLVRITQAAEPFGITVESSAMNDTIESLEALRSEQRLDLKSEDVLSNVVQITDRYLRAGWPKAFEFAVQLEGIFR
jgi:hypothetical protein